MDVNASLASLSEAHGFREFVKANAAAIGITGTIQRYHRDVVRLCVEGTEEQFEAFDQFLLTCISQSMVGAIKNRHEDEFRFRSMNSIVILTDHSRPYSKTRRNGVKSGPFSGGNYEKITEYSASSSEVHA